jgi:hypothetical protein
MSSIIEQVTSLSVGTVEFVSPGEIRVLLDTDAPQATALNTGEPSRFPRINGFVLIPNESGSVIGTVTWLGVERSAYPKRSGLKDFGLIDLPFPLRKMSLSPVGTLRSVGNHRALQFEVERGVSVFPSVGDPVLLPTAEQLRSIIESGRADGRIVIGSSPLSANAKVSVDPDKLFGRHLAVLGNTGSGKSCTVAGLIRWSLEASESVAGSPPNARFIILDPNGEYGQTFADRPNVRVFKVPSEAEEFLPLIVPAWMWNSHEWVAFSQAAPGVQRPLLLRALRAIRSDASREESSDVVLVRRIRNYRIALSSVIGEGVQSYGNSFPGRMGCGGLLRNLVTDIAADSSSEDVLRQAAGMACDRATEIADERSFEYKGSEGFNAFTETELLELRELLERAVVAAPQVSEVESVSVDAPVSFNVGEFAEFLDAMSMTSDGAPAANFVAGLIGRIRAMTSDRRLGQIVNPSDDVSFASWLENIIGKSEATNGEISILDLSLVPTEVVQLVVAVIGRIVFEALQRYRKIHQKVLPTVLVQSGVHGPIAPSGQRLPRNLREDRQGGAEVWIGSSFVVATAFRTVPDCPCSVQHLHSASNCQRPGSGAGQ